MRIQKRKYIVLFIISLFFVCALFIQYIEISSLPAFPGAEGYGSETHGGRGGRIIEVANLNSNGLSIEISKCWLNAKVYMNGNVGPGMQKEIGDSWDLVYNTAGAQIKASASVLESSRVTLQSASKAYELVLQKVGAIIPERDPVDQRIVSDVRNISGSIINSQNEVGGWPVYNSGTPPVDSDHDGMPDGWETEHRLNPYDYSDCCGTDLNSAGYTNVEVYINGLMKQSSTK